MSDLEDEPKEGRRLSRRELLKKAGVGAAAAGAAGATAPFSFAGPMKFKGRWLKGDLSIIQWVHFVPAYDDWFAHITRQAIDPTLDALGGDLAGKKLLDICSGTGHLAGGIVYQASVSRQVHAAITQIRVM